MAKDNNNVASEDAVTSNQVDENVQPGFAIEKLYVKDASLEIPNAPIERRRK